MSRTTVESSPVEAWGEKHVPSSTSHRSIDCDRAGDVGRAGTRRHSHYIVTPTGQCHQVAQGQTAIDDESRGGYRRFHKNVHLGATGKYNEILGHGKAAAKVYKDACP